MRDLFNQKKVVTSFEVFPPKADDNIQIVFNSVKRIWDLSPDYISITRGAGGSEVGMDSVDIAAKLTHDYDVNTVAHLTCINTDRKNIDDTLNRLEDSGIKNILALRGDIIGDGSKERDFDYATDLIEYINERGGFNVCAACYPEGHSESDSIDKDIRVMQIKAGLGVTHFISQLFFDNNDFYNMLELMDKNNIEVPVQAGIMPLISIKLLNRIVRLSGAKIPSRLSKLISRYQDNPECLFNAGINYAIEQMNDLIASGVKGIHIYAMNNPYLAEKIASNIFPITNALNEK